MQWSDVVKRPSEKMLRQFAGLFLVVFLGMAGWRAWSGHADMRAAALAGVATTVGVLGLASPTSVRWIFTGWMIVAFPIGWTVSRIALGLVFYGVFTPVAAYFRATGRDVLRLRRANTSSYWSTKPRAKDVASYYRQS